MTAAEANQILSAGKPLAGKWKLEILWLLAETPYRWNELMKRFPDAAPNVLTRQLSRLEADGLVEQCVYSAKPPKVVEYRLTAQGQMYIPFLRDLASWEKSYRETM